MRQYEFVYNNFEEMQSFIHSNNIDMSHNVLIQVFTGIVEIEFIEKVIGEILSVLPQAEIAGATTAGEMFEASVLTNTTIISFTIFEETKIKSVLLNSNNDEYELGTNIVEELVEEDTKVIILFSDGLLTDSRIIIETIQSANNNVIVCGGKAGDNGHFKETFVFSKTGITQSGVVAVSLAGKELHVTTDFSFGLSTIGKPMDVTKASNNKIHTIDNIKTVDIYKKYLGEQVAKELPMSGSEFPLVVTKDGIEMAKVAYDCNADGSLSFLSNIDTNDKVHFGYVNINMILDQSLAIADRLKKANVEVLFVYSCCIRSSLIQDKVDLEIKPLNNIAPTFGFFTYGEFFTINKSNRLLNATMTVLGISEGNHVFSNNKKPILIKKEGLSGGFFEEKNLGVVKAFTNLVNQSTKELQLANKVLEEQKYKTEQMNNITKFILKMNREMVSPGGIDSCLQSILDKIFAIIPNGKAGSILLLKNGRLYYSATKGYISDKIKDITYKFEDTYYYTGNCAEELFNPVVVKNLEKRLFDKSYAYNLWRDMIGETPWEMLTCAIGIEGQVQGFMNIFNTNQGKSFTEEDKSMVKYLCYDIAIAIKNFELLQNILHMSRYDSLTGLYNRSYFTQTLNNAKLSEKNFVVCMIDLNNLKAINDSYGHDAGDEILVKFADTFKMEMGKNDVLGRIGGDEFAGIFFHKNKNQVMEIINKVCMVFKNNLLYFNGNKEEISFAYGLSEFLNDSEDVSELLKIADRRMYDKKREMKKSKTL